VATTISQTSSIEQPAETRSAIRRAALLATPQAGPTCRCHSALESSAINA